MRKKFLTRTRGTQRQLGKKFPVGPSSQKLKAGLRKIKPKRSIFYEARGKYADIVSIKTSAEANKAVGKLWEEFSSAQTRKKQNRIMRSAMLASNRITAMLRKKDIKSATATEKRYIKAIYDEFAMRCRNSPRRIPFPRKAIDLSKMQRVTYSVLGKGDTIVTKTRYVPKAGRHPSQRLSSYVGKERTRRKFGLKSGERYLLKELGR